MTAVAATKVTATMKRRPRSGKNKVEPRAQTAPKNFCSSCVRVTTSTE